MPIYEYLCPSCNLQFEVLVRNGAEPSACGSCGGAPLQRVITTFAVDSDSTRSSNIARARKQNASQVRDKAIAEREAFEHHDH